jgi:hypothetical protein
MSNVPAGNQIDILYPPNMLVPTYYTNLVQMAVIGDEEVYLNFCTRSPDRPALQANLQCRVITTVSNLRRLTEGLTTLIAQYDQQKAADAAQAQKPR